MWLLDLFKKKEPVKNIEDIEIETYKLNHKPKFNDNGFKASQGDDRSYEDYAWLDTLGWLRVLPPVARQLNDFLAYKRFCDNATQDEIHELLELKEKDGITVAMKKMILKLKEKRSFAYMNKEKFIRDQINKPTVNIREFDEAFAEEERWKHLTPEERRKKQNPLPKVFGQVQPIITIDELIREPILKKVLSSDGIGYIVHDKLYGLYTAAIVSPMKIKADGTYRVEKVIRREHIELLDVPAQIEVSIERRNYNAWLGNNPNAEEIETSKRVNKKVNVDIEHVKQAMGLSKSSNSDLNGDIF